jgi:hypothetical protein
MKMMHDIMMTQKRKEQTNLILGIFLDRYKRHEETRLHASFT